MGRARDLKRRCEERGIQLPPGPLDVADLEELLVQAKSRRVEEEVERDDFADVSTDEEDFDHSQERQEVEDDAAIASIVTWNCTESGSQVPRLPLPTGPARCPRCG